MFSWADPITLFGFYDWMAEPGTGHEYCSWDGPNEEPVCNHHHYEEGLIYMAHQAGAEVYPSIGGWSLSDPFPTMAANAEYRANFVRQCIALIKNYNFDGIVSFHESERFLCFLFTHCLIYRVLLFIRISIGSTVSATTFGLLKLLCLNY